MFWSTIHYFSRISISFACVSWLLTARQCNSLMKKQNPFWSNNFIKLAIVSERQAPPIHARPRLMPGLVLAWIGGACLSETIPGLIKLLLQNEFCFFGNSVRKKNGTIESTNQYSHHYCSAYSHPKTFVNWKSWCVLLLPIGSNSACVIHAKRDGKFAYYNFLGLQLKFTDHNLVLDWGQLQNGCWISINWQGK